MVLYKNAATIFIPLPSCCFYTVALLCNVPQCVGILRYKVDFQSLQADEPLEDVDLDDY